MKRMLIALVAVAATLSLYAVDAGWSNTDTAVQVWTTAANWTNVTDGTTLAAPPTGADDTVAFPFVDPRMRTVSFCGDVDAASGSFGIASVAGPRYWTLQMPGYSYSWNNAQRTFTVGDVNGFKGAWQMKGPFQTIALTAATGVQTLETLSAQSRPVIDVRNAAVEAKVNLVTGAGAIGKKGPGKLTLGVMYDASQDVYLDKGALELTGKMPIRVWPTGASDRINLGGAISGTGCLAPVNAGNARVAAGTVFTLGTYPASLPLPDNSLLKKGWEFSSVAAGEQGKVLLQLTYVPSGLSVIIR